MTGAAMTRQRLDAGEAWAEVEARRIMLIPLYDGAMWQASVERVKKARKWGRDDMEVISATASVSIDAVAALIEKLDARSAWGNAA